MKNIPTNPEPLKPDALVWPYKAKQMENSTGKAYLLPALEIPDITIEADDNDEYNVNKKIEEWGYSEPVVEINDWVLDMGMVESFRLNYQLFSLPTFSLSIDDPKYIIQKKLKNDKDLCKIFIGYADIYIKFRGLITTITGAKTSSKVNLSGILWAEKLYEQQQDLYNQLEEPHTVFEILFKYCKDAQLGLWKYDNTDLNFVPDIFIQPNIKRFDAMIDLINKYTNNIWCIDAFGWLHIGNVESILANDSDTYRFDFRRKFWYADIAEGAPYKKRKLKFVVNRLHVSEEQLEIDYRDKPPYDIYDTDNYYVIDTINGKIESNFAKNILYSFDEYILIDDNSKETKLSDMSIEFGSTNKKKENTFYGFSDLVKQKFPDRQERLEKMLYGNYITLILEQPCYEIVPFSIVELEFYIPSSAEDKEKYKLDEEHSKKHFVVGMNFSYSKNNGDKIKNKIIQTLYLI